MGCGCKGQKQAASPDKEAANQKQRLSRREAVEKFRRERQQRILARQRNPGAVR